MTDSRWLDVDAASRYLSMRADIFLRAVARGTIPRPSLHLGPRTPRWDRAEIDDRLVGAKSDTSMREAVDGVVAQIKAKGAARRQAHEERRHGR